jgi:site-specific DNA-cytosine methylase
MNKSLPWCRSSYDIRVEGGLDEPVENFLFRNPQSCLGDEQLAVLLMSTPCQGFSTTNSRGKKDEKNRKLIDTVPIALRKLEPAFLVSDV